MKHGRIRVPTSPTTCVRNSRKLFTKLRINAHDLLIEHGRYFQPILPVEDRLCTSCKAIDEEVHFVMTFTAQNRFTRPQELMFC